MSKLILKAIANVGDEPFEIYWFVGLTLQAKDAWFVRVVLRGTKTGHFHVRSMPIGQLPLLTLGSVFEHGEMKSELVRGSETTICLADVSQYQVITSADIPAALYSFDGHHAGVQRLFRFETPTGSVMVPAVEWIRYLFLHNRTLANAVMRPGALNLLFVPDVPGYQAERAIRFTKQVPVRCLSERFVKEFAWLALDDDARRAWDSVCRESSGKSYVTFSPPTLHNSTWRFRGVRHGNTWLVLELLHMSGRKVPCRALEYSHPQLKRVIRVDRGTNPSEPNGGKGSGQKRPGHGNAERKYELDDGEEGSQSNSTLRTANGLSKAMAFENQVVVKAQRPEIERGVPIKSPGALSGSGDGEGTKKPKIVKVSAGERAGGAKLPPVEFKLLEPAPASLMGNLDALDETVRHMRDELPGISFSMSLCRLKPGRAFSKVGRDDRAAMIVVVSKPAAPPMVLLDVERTGVHALSLVVLRFYKPETKQSEIEAAAKKMLDGLVDSGGHWSIEVEQELTVSCTSERMPKMVVPRGEMKAKSKVWAMRLIDRLGLKYHRDAANQTRGK